MGTDPRLGDGSGLAIYLLSSSGDATSIDVLALYGFSGADHHLRLAFLIIASVALVVTPFISFFFGARGGLLQTEEFPDDTVLGIWGWHWVWAVIPLYWYSTAFVFVVVNLAFHWLASILDWSLSTILSFPFFVIPLIAWFAPLGITFEILSKERMRSKGPMSRGLAVLAVLLLGGVVANLVQVVCYLLAGKLFQ